MITAILQSEKSHLNSYTSVLAVSHGSDLADKNDIKRGKVKLFVLTQSIVQAAT